jgi:hypothetical protein
MPFNRNQYNRDLAELGWRAALGFWLENRDSGPHVVGRTDRLR